MFIKALQRQNPALIATALRFWQQGLIARIAGLLMSIRCWKMASCC